LLPEANRVILNFLKDIYAKQGYIAVLISVVVLVALALIVAKVGGVDLSILAGWLENIGR